MRAALSKRLSVEPDLTVIAAVSGLQEAQRVLRR
jgi:hypothetical protein